MTEITLPRPRDTQHIPKLIEAFAAEHKLQLKTLTLAKHPGCIHWHLNNPGERGTLEITWWPKEDRLWATIHENRKGVWIVKASELLHQVLLEME